MAIVADEKRFWFKQIETNEEIALSLQEGETVFEAKLKLSTFLRDDPNLVTFVAPRCPRKGKCMEGVCGSRRGAFLKTRTSGNENGRRWVGAVCLSSSSGKGRKILLSTLKTAILKELTPSVPLSKQDPKVQALEP